MGLDSIVSSSISTTATPPSQENFDTPLIAAYHNLWTARTRTYSSLAGMVSDGFRSTDPAYQMASAIFSQQPKRLKRIKIGRRALPFSQVVDLTPVAPSNGKVYAVTVNGDVATYTATGSDTLASVCTALASAINAAAGDADVDAIITTGGSTAGIQTLTGASLNGVVGAAVMNPERALAFVFSSHADWDATTAVVTGTNRLGDTITENFSIPNGGNATVSGTTLFKTVTSVVIPAQTGTGGTFTLGTRTQMSASGASTTKVVVTTTSHGVITTFGSITTDTLSVLDATADPGLATDLDAIYLADKDWYGLVIDSFGKAEAVVGAVWTEANRRLFGQQTADSAVLDPASTTDVWYVQKAASYFRSEGIYHPTIGLYWPAAAWIGNRFPATPGSDTWAFKTLAGIPVYELTETQINAAMAKNGNVYVTIAGRAMTYAETAGKGAKTFGGEFIDQVRGIDDLRSAIQTDTFGVLAGQVDKLPMTDPGIAVVQATVTGTLSRRVTSGFLAASPAPVVTVPKAADISAIDRANRDLKDVEWSATVAGAVHAIEITGTLSS
jgi:hypothetical protein